MLVLLLLAVRGDLRTARISNRLILIGLTGGFLYRITVEGVSGTVTFLIHIFIPVIILILLFLMHALGAGDIKLFSMISSIFSYKEIMYCMTAAFLIGAGMAFVKLVYQKNLWVRLCCFASYLRDMLEQRQFKQYSYGVREPENTIHFSIAIFLGYLISLGVCH